MLEFIYSALSSYFEITIAWKMPVRIFRKFNSNFQYNYILCERQRIILLFNKFYYHVFFHWKVVRCWMVSKSVKVFDEISFWLVFKSILIWCVILCLVLIKQIEVANYVEELHHCVVQTVLVNKCLLWKKTIQLCDI